MADHGTNDDTTAMYVRDSSAPDYGDFVSSDDECEIEELAEPVERYFAGLYYPICIGQVLDQTYRIEHKLGHGGFSTVWMAHDIEKKREVALKILVPGAVGENELGIQNKIISTVPDTSNLLIYENSFYVKDYKGNDHLVLVFPMWGPSLGGSGLRQMPMGTRVSAARQLLKALENLHHGGIVHRDLNNRNVMWGIRSVDNYNTKTKYEYFGRPQKIKLCPHPGWQAELVKPLTVPTSLLRETICLGDFGQAIAAGTSVIHKVNSPVGYCAPELFHDRDPSFASDMWSYMCLFGELYLGVRLFNRTSSPAVVSRMVDLLGPLPEHWKGDYKGAGTSDDSWYDQNRKPIETESLKGIIDRVRPEASQTERDYVLSIMSAGFCYLPESRISATHLQQNPSFKAIIKNLSC